MTIPALTKAAPVADAAPAGGTPASLDEDEPIAAAAAEPLGPPDMESLNGGGDVNLGTGLVTLAASEEEQSREYVTAAPSPPPPREPPLSEDEGLLSGTGLDTLCDTVVLPALQESPPGETEREKRRRLRREEREREQPQQVAAAPAAQHSAPHPSMQPHVPPARTSAVNPKLTIFIAVAVVVVLVMAVTAFVLLARR